ncbi:ribosomal RNA large subunit methyltransferase J [Betaproteobacteria bacterium]|nr:ribosomal RNA large subunit methyltransferase J [Betaproteobacteria bacterium]GHU45074.1 ribosomal RNA large subunit methyltransferase J [Betaproteobacteria bacterium]
MLSYRHAFHAGNHADVLKHVALVQMLDYLIQKPAPLYVIDTHAGAGRYRLDAREAQKLGEFREGIERIWDKQSAPKTVAAYLTAVREMNPAGELKQYPGSPWLAKRALRTSDRLRLFELHSNESRLLAQNFKGAGREVQTTAGDGLALLKSQIPPPSRRALVLIDPSYETKADYANVLAALKDALKRFASGTYALWYPQIAKIESRQLPERLKRLPATGTDWLHVTLRVHAPATDGVGMSGSGMFIINPPWTLADALRDSLPWLTEKLAQDDTAEWKVETSADKTNQ